MYSLLLAIDDNISNICFRNNFFVDKDFISDTVHKIQNVLIENLTNEKINVAQKDYSKTIELIEKLIILEKIIQQYHFIVRIVKILKILLMCVD